MSASSTRDRILDRGLDLLTVTGLAGVTLGVLASELGLSKSGLFAHFRSKEDIQLALLEHSAAIARATVVEPAMRSAEGLPRLTALIDNWLGWTTRAGLRGGCPIAAALFELDDLANPIRGRVAEMEASWRGLLASLVRAAIERRQLRADLDVDQLVWELCGIYLSHHASRRFLQDPQSDARARTAVAALLRRAARPSPIDPMQSSESDRCISRTAPS
jgi:AcrR family transcriptional regulator